MAEGNVTIPWDVEYACTMAEGDAEVQEGLLDLVQHAVAETKVNADMVTLGWHALESKDSFPAVCGSLVEGEQMLRDALLRSGIAAAATLTAARNSAAGDHRLETGALALADRDIVCVDEFQTNVASVTPVAGAEGVVHVLCD